MRLRAAALLATVSRDETSVPSARLHCLAALDALAEPTAWTERPSNEPASDSARITNALHLLGQLPLAQFDQPDVLVAARHARHALRELR